MKKYLYILPLLFGVAFLGSCSEPEGTIVSGVVPYFLTSQYKVEVSPDNDGVFPVEIRRFNSVGAAEVELNAILPQGMQDNMFSLVSNKAVFKDGDFSTTVNVKFDLSTLIIPNVYDFQLAFVNEPILGSSLKPSTVSISRKWVFDTDLGKGKFTSDAFGFEDKEVDVLGINGSDGVYSIKDAYAAGFPINFALIDGGKDIVFKDQKIGRSHNTYGAYSVGLADFSVEGKTINLLLELYVDAGSFGTFVESITLP